MALKEKLKEVRQDVWELPASAKQGMRVPARLFLSKKLLGDVEEGALEQVANVAFLPGIQKYSIALPDMHFGYGFPIGGVAALDFETGGLSPGGIGFDINCTHPDAKVSCSFGTWKRIKNMEADWEKNSLKFLDCEKTKIEDTSVVCFMKRMEDGFVYEIKTESGRKIQVTAEHPILTENGMRKAENLTPNDSLYVYPFSGVEYEHPSSDVIIDASDIEKILDSFGIGVNGNAKTQVLGLLKKLGLDEIKYDSPKLPIIIKIMGFVIGDGVISFVKNRKGFVHFYGKQEDLEEIKKDVLRLGFKCPNVFLRKRNHKIKTFYKTVEFESEEASIVKKSTAFAALFTALGMPHGYRSAKSYRIPKWLMKAPLWQKRLFLSAFFGAELSKPKTLNKYNFYEPQLNMNKLETLKENGMDFLNDIRLLLLEFGVTSAYPVEVEGYQYLGRQGKTCGLRISIHGNPRNLINLFEKIGFEYNSGKHREACFAANYTRLKENVKKLRAKVRNAAIELYNCNSSINEIREKLRGEFTPDQFLEHSVWTEFKNNPRIAFNFISFDEYKKTYAVGDGGMVRDKVLEICKLPYRGYVYDFTINDNNHNFIANNLVVSNCGVRLLRSNFRADDIKPKLPKLLDAMFHNVPSGVGVGGKIKLTAAQLRDVLERGASWAVDNGYGTKRDIDHLEERGCMKGADASKVSDKALKRGAPQLGSLGAGNHFLEVQRVERVFLPDVARAFGITGEGQVTFMIHSGSRGLGHQVCTDYLQILESKFRDEIRSLPDRELIYAPAGTKECDAYFAAMACGANFAWTNRQMIMHWVRESVLQATGAKEADAGIEVVYDVAHNIGKIEEHEIDGRKRKVYVHRKGATRAFPAGHADIPADYRSVGQPVLIPGSMGTASYVLVGTETAKETFYSTAHGAGRAASRTKMLRGVRGQDVAKKLLDAGILSKSASWQIMAEEAPEAYKDVDEVVRVCEATGIARIVAKLRPMAVAKG